MMKLSISVAVFSLLVVAVISISKCCSKILERKEGIISTMSKQCKETSCVRKTNIYGTYGRKNDEDEYEFDSDRLEEDEDTYAVIRDSQVVFQTTVEMDGQCDEYNNYFTSGYNHLNLIGISKTPSN
ncbi:uncharacterized protein LOC127698513 [Mytilus californianus]|uniref:uncharacterized protein LOC127698513 n=1 Tax=Mytilus californianus TaxID=6549 RepID=UPI002246630A|nr:uncharacterized protein LOC127698513 [Mytilus californianus]